MANNRRENLKEDTNGNTTTFHSLGGAENERTKQFTKCEDREVGVGARLYRVNIQ